MSGCKDPNAASATPAGISKHFVVLHASGMVGGTHGGHLVIDSRFRVPGQRANDIGFTLLCFE